MAAIWSPSKVMEPPEQEMEVDDPARIQAKLGPKYLPLIETCMGVCIGLLYIV
jgi:hypothetical protein